MASLLFRSFQRFAFAFSGGLIYTHPKSISCRNHFSAFRLGINNYLNSRKLPLNIALGVSFKPEYFPSCWLTFNDLHRWKLPVLEENPRAVIIFRHLQLGGEATIGKHAYLRWGYNPYQYEQTKRKSH